MRYLAHLAHETTARVARPRPLWLPETAPMLEEHVVELTSTSATPLPEPARPDFSESQAERFLPSQVRFDEQRTSAFDQEDVAQSAPRSERLSRYEQRDTPAAAFQEQAAFVHPISSAMSDTQQRGIRERHTQPSPQIFPPAVPAAHPVDWANTQANHLETDSPTTHTRDTRAERPSQEHADAPVTLNAVLALIAEQQNEIDRGYQDGSRRERSSLTEAWPVSRDDARPSGGREERASSAPQQSTEPEIRLHIGSIVVQVEPTPASPAVHPRQHAQHGRETGRQNTSNRWSRNFLDR